jgi:hypothetical protein
MVSFTSAQTPDKKKTAVNVAQKWLIDSGKYEDSWSEAAGFFKNAVKKDEWVRAMDAYRKPIGKTVSRKLKSTYYEKSMPGAPDGEYYVIEFESSFENKKSATETVTPILDKGGQWRVSGYYIQ